MVWIQDSDLIEGTGAMFPTYCEVRASLSASSFVQRKKRGSQPGGKRWDRVPSPRGDSGYWSHPWSVLFRRSGKWLPGIECWEWPLIHCLCPWAVLLQRYAGLDLHIAWCVHSSCPSSIIQRCSWPSLASAMHGVFLGMPPWNKQTHQGFLRSLHAHSHPVTVRMST